MDGISNLSSRALDASLPPFAVRVYRLKFQKSEFLN